jgi:hypothetical protein
MSSLVSRIQPEETKVPIVDGWLVPWMLQSLTEIECARAEWVAIAPGHEPRQIRLAIDHGFRRIPIRPFRHSRNPLHAGPGKALATHANAMTQRLAIADYEIEIGVRRINDDRAGRLLGLVID